MTANYGGTEIKHALSTVFQSRMTYVPTSVFLLTDGEVWFSLHTKFYANLTLHTVLQH